MSALSDGGTSRLVSWDSTCTEEEACVVLDPEGTLGLWLETSTARLSDTCGALTWNERRIHNCIESMTHLIFRGDQMIRVTDANFHAGARRGKSLFLNQLFPILDIGDRVPRDFL